MEWDINNDDNNDDDSDDDGDDTIFFVYLFPTHTWSSVWEKLNTRIQFNEKKLKGQFNKSDEMPNILIFENYISTQRLTSHIHTSYHMLQFFVNFSIFINFQHFL